MTAGNKAPDSGVASLCSRKRKQTLEGPLPLVADPLATTPSQDTRVKKKRGGRPREANASLCGWRFLYLNEQTAVELSH